MERTVVVNNKSLEEFLERLLRWGELCRELRELYYKYLDLAAFRSEKCFYPGRRCKRPWGREYDVGDLTLMWTYIANTAPLCGRLMKALAEVEYKIRLKALESLEKYGGVEKRMVLGGHYVTQIRLKRPIYGYLVFLEDKLYIIWGEFDGLSKGGRDRATDVERKVIDIIRQIRRKSVIKDVDEYEVDAEYKRLWLEIPLSGEASKLLGGKNKASISLFRNLGWLLSDDDRSDLAHGSSNLGQTAVRIFDWIALATINAKKLTPGKPLVFKLVSDRVTMTKDGPNPTIDVRPMGTAGKLIRTIYEQFGISLNKPENVVAHGYAVLKVLKKEAFKRNGNVYVVDDVKSWIAFSNIVATLTLGDGSITPFEIDVATHIAKVGELAKALGGVAKRATVAINTWHIRLLLPVPPSPAFEKSVKLYDAIVNYPSAAVVNVNGVEYLFVHAGPRQFAIRGRRRVAELKNVLEQYGIRFTISGDTLKLPYTQLKELAKYVPVRVLNDMEKDGIREIKPVSSPDLDAVRNALEKIARMAKIDVSLRQGRYYVRIKPYDASKLWEIVSMLKVAGLRVVVANTRKYILIYEQKSVEAIFKTAKHFFPRLALDGV